MFRALPRIVFFLVASFFLANFVLAGEITITNSLPLPRPGLNILEKIKEGKSLLKNSAPLLFETKKFKNGKPSGDLVRKQVVLAILNKNTGAVFEYRIWVREEDVKSFSKTGVVELESVLGQDNLNIQARYWNSFNTFYEIIGRPELAVVANKYLLPSKSLIGLPEQSKNQYTEIIYAPYSEAIHLPEIIEAGKKYLENHVGQAFSELEADKVFSRSAQSGIVTAAISKDFIKNIILVEHIDPDSFNVASDGGKELTERVLAVIGANQEFAYRYTGSPAGANGLAQFIRPTYRTIVTKYPEAHLVKDFNLGMANHINAIKAMVLFFDRHKEELVNKINRQEIVEGIGITEEMLAAAYNGGPNKVARSINRYGLAWIDGQADLPRARTVFRRETLNYIKKFKSVKDLNVFANPSVN